MQAYDASVIHMTACFVAGCGHSPVSPRLLTSTTRHFGPGTSYSLPSQCRHREEHTKSVLRLLLHRREWCKVLQSACLYVFLSVHSHVSKTTCPNFMEFFLCYLRQWLGPHLMTMQYIMYFRFCRWRHVFT